MEIALLNRLIISSFSTSSSSSQIKITVTGNKQSTDHHHHHQQQPSTSEIRNLMIKRLRNYHPQTNSIRLFVTYRVGL